MSRNSFFQNAGGVLVATPEIEAEGAVGQSPKGGMKAGLYVDLERREEGTMRTSLVLLFIGVLVAFGGGVLTNPTPAAAVAPGPSPLACPAVMNPDPFAVTHCDKILFSPKGHGLVFQCPSFYVEPYDNPGVDIIRFDSNDTLDIKVLDDPQKVADVRAKVAQFMNQSGCFAEKDHHATPIDKTQIKILDVEYVVIPPSNSNNTH